MKVLCFVNFCPFYEKYLLSVIYFIRLRGISPL